MAALKRAEMAVESNSASSATLPSGARFGLEGRIDALRAALAPLPDEHIRVILMSLGGMAGRVEPDPKFARALADQAVADLRHAPGFALIEAADAFRQGRVGDGHWRPMPGELLIEAQRRAEPFFVELQKIERVLSSRQLSRPPEERISGKRFAELSAMLAGLKEGQTAA